MIFKTDSNSELMNEVSNRIVLGSKVLELYRFCGEDFLVE